MLAEFIGAPVEFSASGATVVTYDGREMINCGGYSVFLLGHSHPAVVDAVVAQLQSRALATKVLMDPVMIEAADRLGGLVPDHLERIAFANSGAEATELALKIARLSGRRNVISTSGGYHGKTTGALSVTSNPKYQDPFQPLLPASVVEFGDVQALDRALGELPSKSAAFIVEPIQGEGGVRIPPPSYLADVSAMCSAYDALLIVDEIQTGLGRCGALWAHPPECSPDVMLIGKALSGGVVPCAAVAVTAKAFDILNQDPGLHSSTFAGCPIQGAAMTATLDIIVRESIPERAAKIGNYLLEGLRQAAHEHPRSGVVQVRGRGVLLGVEFTTSLGVAETMTHMLSSNVIVNHSLNSSTVLRLTPPAILSRRQCDQVIGAFAAALDHIHES